MAGEGEVWQVWRIGPLLKRVKIASQGDVGTREAPDKMPVRLPSLDRGHHQYLPY